MRGKAAEVIKHAEGIFAHLTHPMFHHIAAEALVNVVLEANAEIRGAHNYLMNRLMSNSDLAKIVARPTAS